MSYGTFLAAEALGMTGRSRSGGKVSARSLGTEEGPDMLRNVGDGQDI